MHKLALKYAGERHENKRGTARRAKSPACREVSCVFIWRLGVPEFLAGPGRLCVLF